MPLPVTEDTPPDMLAGAMDIKVLLPSGRTVNMSVERSTPMMDLLVQLTTVHKLSLAGHTTVALSDSGYPLHHLPSTPLGALDTRVIHVAQRTNTLKRAPLRPNNVQPFTTTFRLQVHLPRNQLFVTRVSPDTRLSDILRLACSEKNLDPKKYELRHPANLCECLSLSHTLADYRLQEVTLVASRPPGTPLTPADIMALQREEEKRRQQVKKTGGIYSIIFNKRSKGIPEGSGSVSSDSLNGRSISPARSDESIERSVSPPAPAPPQRPGRKRRPAPKPPAPASTSTHLQNNGETGVDSSKEGSTTLSHSRTSSDSSGYHEASVLSESADTRTNSSADTLPRRSKLPSTNHIVAKNKSSTLQHGTSNVGNHNLSRSLSNLTAVGINSQNMHSASTSSLASQGLMPRKKKAAPPPPAAPVKILHDNNRNDASKPTEVVAALLHDIKTFDQNTTIPSPDNSNADKRLAHLDKHISKPVQNVPKLDDILDEEDIVLDLTTTKRNSVPKLENVEQTSMESLQSVTEEHIPSLDIASSRVEHLAAPIISPDLVTSAIVHAPPPAIQELTQSRPKPRPRVLERPQPQPVPRQIPPLREEAELLPSATALDRHFSKMGETEGGLELDRESPRVIQVELKKEKDTVSDDIDLMDSQTSAYVSQTMLVHSDAASSHSSNSNHSRADCVELDNDEVEIFEVPKRSATIECINNLEETSNFSDLGFETSSLSSTMSGLDPVSYDNGNVVNMSQSSTGTTHILDSMGSAANLHGVALTVNEEAVGSCVTSLNSLAEMRKYSVGSSTSLSSLGKVNEVAVESAETLNSFSEKRKDMIAPSTRINSVETVNEVPVAVGYLSSRTPDEEHFLITEKTHTGNSPSMKGLTTIESAFILGDQDDEEEGIPPSIESVLRDNATSSPDVEEVPDWQYHLPAPPSAFRDLHSPTTTEFETVVLADANVFQEVTHSQSNQQNNYKPVQKFDHMVQSSTSATQEGSTQDDCISNDTKSITSLQNGHCSLSPQSSVDNNENYLIEKEAVKPSKTAVNSESDWEPQTIAVAEHASRTKPKFNNGDLRLRQDGVTKEVYKVNPIFNNRHFEDDIASKEIITPPKSKLEENEIHKYNNSISRASNTDLQLSNQLKNFTISTYSKPQNIDSIFSENQTDETDSVFKKPFAPSNFLPVTRTNSYSKMDKDRPVPSVKRSTSYVSLARPYAKPSTFQSISRTKSISSLVREEDPSSSSLRKSTSDANLNQVDNVPLQSLQVIKAILPRLSQSQIIYDQSEDTNQSQSRNQTIVQDTHISTDIDSKISQLATNTQENASETVLHSSQERKSAEVPKSEPPRPFVYRGPPAVNFSTWSERPKVQVSLKSDRDYRMGKQSTITNVNTGSSQVNSQQTSKETAIMNTNSNVNNISSVANLIKKEITQNKLTVLNNTEDRSNKIEPTPLTMRIVSHTSSNHRNNTSLAGNINQSSQVAKQEKAELQKERLPIVRAVELKKTQPESSVLLRNMSTTHLNGSNSNNVANVPVSYHQGTLYNRHSFIEPTFGSVMTNALTKSVSTSQINIEAPENSFQQSKHVSNGGKKYTSVIGINGSGAGSAKVIQHSASVQNMQPSVQIPRSQSVRQTFNTVKVNSFSGPKPMPIVKGFRFAGTEAANYDHGPVKISIEQEKTEHTSNSMKYGSKSGSTNELRFDPKATKQPLKTINGIENLKAKLNTSQTFGAKVQQTTPIVDRVDGRNGNNIPEPPKPPAMMLKKPSQRPVQRFTNPRDELMDAIKNFGGRESLKSSKPKTNTNVILTI